MHKALNLTQFLDKWLAEFTRLLEKSKWSHGYENSLLSVKPTTHIKILFVLQVTPHVSEHADPLAWSFLAYSPHHLKLFKALFLFHAFSSDLLSQNIFLYLITEPVILNPYYNCLYACILVCISWTVNPYQVGVQPCHLSSHHPAWHLVHGSPEWINPLHVFTCLIQTCCAEIQFSLWIFLNFYTIFHRDFPLGNKYS